ncbi:MAG: hypothetical protein IJR99_15225 [Kiritimatiellae bacterium]|nr:hypothetical protein [Kiritimatiellia bacterium]
MKKGIILSVLAAVATFASAQMATMKLIEITDMSGGKAYEIMDNDAFNELRTQIAEEQKLFNQGVNEAKKLWAENKEVKGNFPASIVKARQFRIVTQGNEEMLNKRKEKLEERLEDAKAKEAEKEEKKLSSIRNEEQKAKAMEKLENDRKKKGLAVSLVSKWMAEKLGRTIPSYSQDFMAFGNPLAAAADKKDAKDKDKDKKDAKDKKADKEKK